MKTEDIIRYEQERKRMEQLAADEIRRDRERFNRQVTFVAFLALFMVLLAIAILLARLGYLQ